MHSRLRLIRLTRDGRRKLWLSEIFERRAKWPNDPKDLIREATSMKQSHRSAQFANYDASGRLWGRYFFVRHVDRYSLRRYNLRKPTDKMYSRQRIRAPSNVFNRYKLLSTTLVAYRYWICISLLIDFSSSYGASSAQTLNLVELYLYVKFYRFLIFLFIST